MINLTWLSLHSFTLITFIILIGVCTSTGEADRYQKCCSSLISCGATKSVGYPFWGLGRPRYCGHPALQLECPEPGNEYAVLTIGEHKELKYSVFSINNTSPNIIIQLGGFVDRCPYHATNKVFDNIFQFSEGVKNITLYDECDGEEIKDVPSRFQTCWGNNNSRVYYTDKTLSPKAFHGCNRLEVPVIKQLEVLLQTAHETVTLYQILKQGFKVNYKNSFACSKCENSNGTCGSNGTEFACFRPITDIKNTADVPQDSHTGHRKLISQIAISGACILIAVIALNVGFWCCLKRRNNSPMSQSSKLPSVPINSDLETGSSFYGIPVFPYNELQEATKNFNESQKLGDGGFGVVYYGKLKDGREVAVKRLYEKNSKRIAYFVNEIEIFTGLHHPNLVTLYGCTSRNSRELLLVYEFIPNGTVADHLFGDRKGSETLSWDIRMKIATGTARALSYLHASDIIHRDVKTNNILLDSHFSVKVADFGLSRLFPVDTTHVSTAPQGTPGYLDPSYNKCYKVTDKSDVYSFGVVLVELISSLPAVDTNRKEGEINLSDYAMNRIQHGTLNELVDQKLGFETDFKVRNMITLVAELAFRCLQQERELRPSMDEVLKVLKQIGSSDYEASKTEENDRSIAGSVPTLMTAKDGIDPPSENTQHPTSPNSVFSSWVSRSSASSTSR